MSGQRKIPTIGENWTLNEVQRVANVAAAGDDRALSILATPGGVQKRIMPLSEESISLNPQMLVVGKDTDATLVNGKVRVRPAHFVAGTASAPYDISIGAKLIANLDSAIFGNNSSGSTRFDLLYATVNFGTLTTTSKKQKDPTSGIVSPQTLTIAADPLVTLGIIPNVSSSTPLASLPADPGDGSAYNFGLAMVALPNGFSGGAINQSIITPLWDRGWVRQQRIRGIRTPDWNGANPSERPSSQVSSRFSAAQKYLISLKLTSSTPAVPSAGTVIDASIDWRYRVIWGTIGYYSSATNLPLEGLAAVLQNVANSESANYVPKIGFSGAGSNTVNVMSFFYNTSTKLVLGVNSSGQLALQRVGSPADGTNGDQFLIVLEASEQFLNGI